MNDQIIDEIESALRHGNVIPYIGPGVLSLVADGQAVPASAEALVAKLTASSSVPPKLRKNLTGAAQFMENFKHRKTVSAAMTAAFGREASPSDLHHLLARIPNLPLIVHAWYDDLPQKAFASRENWGVVQGVSQAEHYGQWVHYFHKDGTRAADDAAAAAVCPEAGDWKTLIYQPIGSISPAKNYLVSDSDYVEVLTEIDIQTPIPQRIQELRVDRNFLFLGCRFSTQLERTFARQIMKRSSSKHWAVLPEEPTRNEARFMLEQNIQRVEMHLGEFIQSLSSLVEEAALMSIPPIIDSIAPIQALAS